MEMRLKIQASGGHWRVQPDQKAVYWNGNQWTICIDGCQTVEVEYLRIFLTVLVSKLQGENKSDF